jgi:hypothetical protein
MSKANTKRRNDCKGHCGAASVEMLSSTHKNTSECPKWIARGDRVARDTRGAESRQTSKRHLRVLRKQLAEASQKTVILTTRLRVRVARPSASRCQRYLQVMISVGAAVSVNESLPPITANVSSTSR